MRFHGPIARLTTTCLLVLVPLYAQAKPAPDRVELARSARYSYAAANAPATTLNANGEVLRGTEAARHLANLKARKSAAFGRAEALLRQRGFRPTNTITAARSLSLTSGGGHSSGDTRLVSSDGSGEITVWAWDDGDDSTWEGLVYVERYGEGSTLFDTQMLISNADPIWAEAITYEVSPGGPDQQQTKLERQGEKVASLSHSNIQLVQERSFQQRVRDWGTCAFFWCSGAAVGCAALGPAWFGCFVAACWTAYIGCAETLFRP